MKAIVLRGFCMQGAGDVYPGDVVEVPGWLYLAKLQSGHLAPCSDPAPEPDLVRVSDPVPQHRDPQKKGKRYGK